MVDHVRGVMYMNVYGTPWTGSAVSIVPWFNESIV